MTFNVGIDNATPVLVELTASVLADNTSLADLVEDINAKLKDTPFGAADAAPERLRHGQILGRQLRLGKARVKFEAASTVSRLEITRVGVNALALPTNSVATNFAGKLVADSIGNKLVLSVETPETSAVDHRLYRGRRRRRCGPRSNGRPLGRRQR